MDKRFRKISYIDVDQFSMRTLKAVYTKLVRDYMGFFGSLQELYGQSKQRKRIDDTFSKVKKTVIFLRNILVVGTISKKEAEILASDIEKINEDKDYFVEQAQNIYSFKERISKVAEITGISLEDLSITREAVRKGVKQARTQVRIARRRRAPILRGAMPETRRITKGLVGGMGVAALGPFAPIAGMGYGIARDILGLGRRVGRFGIERVRERRMRGLERGLQPLAQNVPLETLERMRTRRGVAPYLGRYGAGRVSPRRSKEEAVSALTYFFDKKAHKAKWTRMVLKWIKESSKPKRGMLGGLISSFKNLLPILAAVGLALGKAGLIGAVTVFTGVELYRLTKLTREYYDVLKNVKDFQEKQIRVLAKQEERVAGTVIFGKTERERQVARRARKVYQQAEQKRLYEEATSGFWNRGLSGVIIKYFAPSPTETPLSTLPPIEVSRRSSQFSDISTSLEVQEKMLEAINNVAEEIKREKEVPAIRQAGLGNIYDSTGDLLNEQASGNLTIED